uniref:Uncharacterized protein n=1 Tax=Rhizophora mucronata TaxID=61149 RepID=A0A2P2IMF3_RHIMU
MIVHSIWDFFLIDKLPTYKMVDCLTQPFFKVGILLVEWNVNFTMLVRPCTTAAFLMDLATELFHHLIYGNATFTLLV